MAVKKPAYFHIVEAKLQCYEYLYIFYAREELCTYVVKKEKSVWQVKKTRRNSLRGLSTNSIFNDDFGGNRQI